MRSILLFLAACMVLVSNAVSQDPSSEQPKRISAPQPIFPDGAEDEIYGNSITVFIVVDKKGKVIDAWTYGPLTPCSNIYDPVAVGISEAALAAAKANVFEPIQRKGKPIEATLPIRYPLRRKIAPPEPETKIDEANILNGKARKVPQPEYPFDASRARISGEATIRVLVGENGEVLSARPVSGKWLFFESSVKAACKARFSPTLHKGVPIRVTGTITYNFGESDNRPPPIRTRP